MREPTEQIEVVPTESGSTRKVKLYSYVVTLTEQDGASVMAIRVDGAQNKYDVYTAMLDQYPGWNIKTISKLYESDFDVQ